MMHIEVRQMASGRWAIVGKTNGQPIHLYETEQEARDGCRPWHELTPEQRARRFGDPRLAGQAGDAVKEAAYEASLIARFDARLPMTRENKRRARILKRSANPG